MTTGRRELVLDLVRLRMPLREAIDALTQLPWDCEEELVLLGAPDALRVMCRYLCDQMTSDEVHAWADALEARDDVGMQDDARELLEEFIFTMANPLITEPLTPERARVWQANLARPS